METKTHWKKLHDPNFLGSYSLADNEGKYQDLIIRFKSIAKSEVKGEDGKEAEKIVGQVHDNKPMIINATNAKMLTKLFNSAFIEDWLDKPVTLTVKKIRAFGESVDALRIGNVLPTQTAQAPVKQKPEFAPGHAKWEGAIEALKTGVTDMDKLKAVYNISPENESLLTVPERHEVS